MNHDLLLQGGRWLPALLVVVALFLPAPAQAQPPATVDDETCLGCHEGMDATLAGSPHALTAARPKPKKPVACANCHWGAAVHIEDPSAANITNPGKADVQKATAVCQACHIAHHEVDNIGFDPHLGGDLTCAACHAVHAGTDGLLKDGNLKFCGDCHVALGAQFTRRSVHPVADGNVTCLSCHDFTGESEPAFGHGPGARCYECHPEQSGPYLYEHQATGSFSPEGAGCTSCHAPHGSANDRLLTQTGDGLCRQCHGIPPLHLTFHGGVGSQYPCLECHTDIHGSYTNKNLLDANLSSRISAGPEGCDCHGVDN